MERERTRHHKCPRCGKEVPRYKDAVPGRGVVFEYFICDDGMFTVVWNYSKWTDGIPHKPFVALGYVVDNPLPIATSE